MTFNDVARQFLALIFNMFLTLTMTLAYPNLNSFMPFIPNVLVAATLSISIWGILLAILALD